MSDIHLLDQDEEGKGYNVAFHFPVPIGNNGAGVAWSLVIDVEKNNNFVSVVANIDPLEQIELDNITKMEFVRFVQFSSTSISDAAKLLEVRNIYSDLQTEINNNLSNKYDFYGLTAAKI